MKVWHIPVALCFEHVVKSLVCFYTFICFYNVWLKPGPSTRRFNKKRDFFTEIFIPVCKQYVNSSWVSSQSHPLRFYIRTQSFYRQCKCKSISKTLTFALNPSSIQAKRQNHCPSQKANSPKLCECNLAYYYFK